MQGVDFAYWWSCIGKGLRLQPVQQACYCMNLQHKEQNLIMFTFFSFKKESPIYYTLGSYKLVSGRKLFVLQKKIFSLTILFCLTVTCFCSSFSGRNMFYQKYPFRSLYAFFSGKSFCEKWKFFWSQIIEIVTLWSPGLAKCNFLHTNSISV